MASPRTGGWTFPEIGVAYGVAPVRARQIFLKAQKRIERLREIGAIPEMSAEYIAQRIGA